MEPKQLQALLSGLRRWALHHEARCSGDHPWWMPASLDLAQWLEQLHASKPDSTAGIIRTLRWWRSHVGVPLPLDDPVVATYRLVRQGHATSQQVPLEVFFFFFLEFIRLATSACGAVSLFSPTSSFDCDET